MSGRASPATRPTTGLDEVDTPALVVDLDILEGNIDRIASACRRNGIRWRPHIKGQKVPEIVRMQFAAGARGITCAKLAEAEIMAAAGIDDILVANQIVGARKIGRLVRLREAALVTVAADSVENVAELGAAASAVGVVLPVVIEIEVGMKRAGVEPHAAPSLAKAIAATAGLEFAGVMGWEGHAAKIDDPMRKRAMIGEAVGRLLDAAAAIRASGLPVGIVSCGGTGTYAITTTISGVTEIQAGGGIFSDVAYRTQYRIDHPCALTVLSTVTSRPTPTRIVCDAGKKSLSVETALPRPVGLDGVAEVRFSAEHAVIELAAPAAAPRPGDKILFEVGYTDTTVNLHDEMIAVRDGRVEAIWAVAARGKSR
jgi:D-serine deaminase-like pyridoxal phosphate-dependent protein